MEEKVYNEELTEILTDYDLSKGYLKEIEIVIHHDEVPEVKEVSHKEVVAEYENGGQDVEIIIDVPHKDAIKAYDEKVKYLVYVPYTEEELLQRERELALYVYKGQLAETDYEALKYAEGWFTEEEYAPIKQHREELREKIRQLEEKLI